MCRRAGVPDEFVTACDASPRRYVVAACVMAAAASGAPRTSAVLEGKRSAAQSLPGRGDEVGYQLPERVTRCAPGSVHELPQGAVPLRRSARSATRLAVGLGAGILAKYRAIP